MHIPSCTNLANQTVGEKEWKIDKKSLQSSQDLIRFYFFDYDNSGIPSVVPSNWNKIRTQIARPVRARQGTGAGGAQLVR